MRVAVVGHVEWIEFARVERLPGPGDIVHVLDSWQEPGGGGAVAAGQLAKLAGEVTFFTALGDDALGHRSKAELEEMGIRVHAAWRPEPQRRAFVHVDGEGERTITVIGARMGPSGEDGLPWNELCEADAVYLCAGDAAAVRAARAAATLVSTVRGIDTLREAAVELDALVASRSDPGERYDDNLEPTPAIVTRTAGAEGGEWERPGGERGRWEAVPLPGPPGDAYGCGDSFAAALTFALGRGDSLEDALRLGARCGAACRTGRGPYAGQASG